jgi:hypothetical protein
MTPLGSPALGPLGNYSKPRVVVYRTAVATREPPYEVRPTGWTCSASWDPRGSTGIQYSCWRAEAVVSFQFS